MGEIEFSLPIIGDTSIAKRIGDRGQPCLMPDLGQISEDRHTPPLMIKAIRLLKRFKSRETSSGGEQRAVKKEEANWWVTES